MLLQKQIPSGEYRHNYVRLILVVGTLILFIGHIVVQQLAERGDNCKYRRRIQLEVLFQFSFKM